MQLETLAQYYRIKRLHVFLDESISYVFLTYLYVKLINSIGTHKLVPYAVSFGLTLGFAIFAITTSYKNLTIIEDELCERIKLKKQIKFMGII